MTLSIEKTRRIVELLKDGKSFRKIAEDEGVSLTKVYRLSELLTPVDKEQAENNRKQRTGIEGLKSQLIEYQEKKEQENLKRIEELEEKNKSMQYFINNLGVKVIKGVEEIYNKLSTDDKLSLLDKYLDYDIKNKQCVAHILASKREE